MEHRYSLIGRLAAGVAHDLTTYLWVVDLSLLKIERKGGFAEQVRPAREAAQRALQLSGCLLAYARGGAPEPAAVDLGELVRRVLDLFRLIIPERVEVVVRTPAEVPLVRGVASELEQLLLNLVLNGCDAMPQGGTLEVTVHADDDDRLSLEVADSGCGDHPPGRANGKAGLGLAIVHGVAERHGATLQITPRPYGGTSCVVSLPARSCL